MKNWFGRHSSTILTWVGAAGVIATAVTAVRATPKAVMLLERAEWEKGDKLTPLETVKTVGSTYLPSVAIGLTTLSCMFGANVLNKKQQAALIGAYALINETYKEHKEKLVELFGKEANVKVTEAIAKDKYEPIELEDDQELFFDRYSGRYFNSTIERVLYAEYEINRSLYMNGEASVNELYELIGIDPIQGGNMFCRSINGRSWIDFEHTMTVMDDGLECCIVDFSFLSPTDYAYTRN